MINITKFISGTSKYHVVSLAIHYKRNFWKFVCTFLDSMARFSIWLLFTLPHNAHEESKMRP